MKKIKFIHENRKLKQNRKNWLVNLETKKQRKSKKNTKPEDE